MFCLISKSKFIVIVKLLFSSLGKFNCKKLLISESCLLLRLQIVLLLNSNNQLNTSFMLYITIAKLALL